jgi:hypothetical protein
MEITCMAVGKSDQLMQPSSTYAMAWHKWRGVARVTLRVTLLFHWRGMWSWRVSILLLAWHVGVARVHTVLAWHVSTLLLAWHAIIIDVAYVHSSCMQSADLRLLVYTTKYGAAPRI